MNKYLLTAIFLLSTAATGISHAQLFVGDELVGRLIQDHHTGMRPVDLESLVGSASHIVKGRFGSLISHGPFWGYGESRESIRRRLGDREELIDRVAVPLSEYEIIVDEVLLGPLKETTLRFHSFESDPKNSAYADQETERLFFLVLNPDGRSYSVYGPAFILHDLEGEYVYDVIEWNGNLRLGRHDFSATLTSQAFEAQVREEIARQLTIR